MKQLQGFIDPTKPSHACYLNKALYRLKQAPRSWFTKLKTYLITQGFKVCKSDTSLFVHQSSLVTIYVLVYVDDLIVTSTNATLIHHFIPQIHQNFAPKYLGDLHFFLGIQIMRHAQGLTKSQVGFINNILTCTHMTDAYSISSPVDSQSCLTMHGDPFFDPMLYRQVVGSRQYTTIT